MSDPHKAVLVAYEIMGFCNPVWPSTLDRVLAWARLKPGQRVLDVGCGNAAMARHLARNYGVSVDAVERSAAVAEIARRRLEGAPGVTIHNLDSNDLPKAEPYDLVLSVGASGVVRPPEPEAVMKAVSPHVRPGGLLLWADPFWKAEPDPAFAAWVAPYACYKSHAGNIEAGHRAGLEIAYAIETSQQEWDDCAMGMWAAARAWLADNPGHPEAEGVRERAVMQRDAYLNHGRACLGFGLYLFSKP